MTSALIGYTGFVGSTLLSQRSFDALYNSSNIDEIRGREFDFLVCAGAPAAKWKANNEPEADLANICRLTEALAATRAASAVLISTVDVYASPAGVDEDTPVNPETTQPYGRHRFHLEQFFAGRYGDAACIRLPGLFGKGLRKNFIFDLMGNPDALHLTHADSVFQFYDMSRLSSDIDRVLASDIPLINFATEPVSARAVAERCFSRSFENRTAAPPVWYDMRTRHASVFGRTGAYIATADEVFASIRKLAEAATGT